MARGKRSYGNGNKTLWQGTKGRQSIVSRSGSNSLVAGQMMLCAWQRIVSFGVFSLIIATFGVILQSKTFVTKIDTTILKMAI